jgi:hypothetical protein
MSKFAVFNQIEELFSQLPLDFKIETVKVLSESINSGGRKLLPMVSASTAKPKATAKKTNGDARGRYATVGAQYLDYMRAVEKPVSARMVAEALKIRSIKRVYGQLDHLHRKGKIRRHSVGKYVPA